MDRSRLKVTVITIIRAAIGWHFLYEGFSKLLMESWSSQSYLANASGFLSGFYHWLAAGETMVKVVDMFTPGCFYWNLHLAAIQQLVIKCCRLAS